MKKKKIAIAAFLICSAIHCNLQTNVNAIEITFPNGGGLVSAEGGLFDDLTVNNGTGEMTLGDVKAGVNNNEGGTVIVDKNKTVTIEEGKELSNENGTLRLKNKSKIKNSGSAINGKNGIIESKTGVVITNNETGIFENKGTLSLASDSKIKNKGKFNNSGKINNVAGTITNNKKGTFTNTGDINNKNSGGVDNNGIFDNKGNITLETGSYLTNGKEATFNNYGKIDSLGSSEDLENFTNIESNGNFNNFGQINSKGDFDNYGTLNNAGEIINGGDFINHKAGGVINNTGKFTIEENAKMRGNGIFNNTGTIYNSGKIKNALAFSVEEEEGSEPQHGLHNKQGGIIYNEAQGVIDALVLNEGGKIINNGKFKYTGELYNNNGGVIVNNNAMKSEIITDGGTIYNNETGKVGGDISGSNTTLYNAGKIDTIDINLDNSTIYNTGKITTSDIYNKNENGTGDLIVYNTGKIIAGEIGNKKDTGNIIVHSTGMLRGVDIVGEKTTVNQDGLIKEHLNVNGGATFHLGKNATFFDDSANDDDLTGYVIVGKDSILDATNSTINKYGEHVQLKNNSKVRFDISSATGDTDKFQFGVNNGNPKNITLDDFNPIADIKVSRGFVSMDELKKTLGVDSTKNAELNLTFGDSAKADHKFLSPLRWMNAKAVDNYGTQGQGILFAPTGNGYKDFNPSVMASPIAAQLGGYLTQLNSYDEAFRNMDMYMLMTKKQRQALKLRNKYAAADGNLIFDPTNTPYDDKAVWVRPYATFENVPLKGGPRVSNVAYGSYFGMESELYDLGNGWDGMYGIYAGYNGSHQAYDGIGIYQNGGTLGLVGMAYKGNFFTGLTVNAGANVGEADTFYGQDNFTLLMAGIANKTGYNWELAEGKFIIQPSLMASYSFVNTFDYTNSAGINIDADALHAVTFEPGLKFIGNLKNGWQPYAGVSVVWNILDKTQFQASDATLPELSVKPFVKYGIGVRKTWGERLTGFFQTYFTNGGRNGVGFQLGFRMTLGKGGNGNAKKSNVPVLPKTNVKLSERG